MTNRREVGVDLGKRHYRIQTELDDATFKEVVDLVNEVCDAIGNNVDQENRLMLTCLQLSYNLKKISQTAERLNGRLIHSRGAKK